MTSPSVHRALSPDTTKATAWHGIKVLDLALETKGIANAHDPERTARTLARLGTLRLTLMRLERGAKVRQHHSDHELSIQTVSGRVVIHAANERLELRPGQLVVCERGLAHDIEAPEESAILITIGMSQRGAPRATEVEAPLAED